MGGGVGRWGCGTSGLGSLDVGSLDVGSMDVGGLGGRGLEESYLLAESEDGGILLGNDRFETSVFSKGGGQDRGDARVFREHDAGRNVFDAAFDFLPNPVSDGRLEGGLHRGNHLCHIGIDTTISFPPPCSFPVPLSTLCPRRTLPALCLLLCAGSSSSAAGGRRRDSDLFQQSHSVRADKHARPRGGGKVPYALDRPIALSLGRRIALDAHPHARLKHRLSHKPHRPKRSLLPHLHHNTASQRHRLCRRSHCILHNCRIMSGSGLGWEWVGRVGVTVG